MDTEKTSMGENLIHERNSVCGFLYVYLGILDRRWRNSANNSLSRGRGRHQNCAAAYGIQLKNRGTPFGSGVCVLSGDFSGCELFGLKRRYTFGLQSDC